MRRAWLVGVACWAIVGTTSPVAADPSTPNWEKRRRLMLEHQLVGRDIVDKKVLDAMGTVPRHLFVPEGIRARAYEDRPLPIGQSQTISQPYIVAFMTQAVGLRGGEKVLEVGTGSGYQAAVLGAIVDRVYSIEILERLAQQGQANLAAAGVRNVTVRVGDGYRGWPEEAPFDAIVVTAAPDHVPQPLVEQLKPGGRLVIPVGGGDVQRILVVRRTAEGSTTKAVLPVRFVPMTGEAQRRSANPSGR